MIGKVFDLCAEFRRAIEKTRFVLPPMDRFPNGACGQASILLSEYLQQHGYKTIYYCGLHVFEDERRKPWSHAWLILENHLIADITGDQFRTKSEFLNYDIPVYVGEEDEFHTLFPVKQTLHRGGINLNDNSHNNRVLRIYYERIMENM